MGLGVKVKRKGLWRDTKFKPALLVMTLNPGSHGVGGSPSSPTATLAVPGTKKDASGKIPARKRRLPRFLQVARERHKGWGRRSSSGQQLRSEKPGKSPCPRVRVEIITSTVNTDLLQSLLRLALENGSFPNHFMHVLKTCSESMTKQITELVCI